MVRLMLPVSSEECIKRRLLHIERYLHKHPGLNRREVESRELRSIQPPLFPALYIYGQTTDRSNPPSTTQTVNWIRGNKSQTTNEMASSQYNSLTPLQQFNQQQHQHQQQQQQQHQQHQHQRQQQFTFQSIAPQPHTNPYSQPQHQHQHHLQQAQAQAQRQTTLPTATSSSDLTSPPSPPQLPLSSSTPLSAAKHQNAAAAAAAAAVVTNDANADLNANMPIQINGPPTTTTPPRGRGGRPRKRPRAETPHPPAAPHPFSRGPYYTLEDAVFNLQLHVFTSGYGVSQKRTVKEKLPSGQYNPAGSITRKDFSCDRGGNEFVSQSRGERNRESRKCGCPWRACIRRLKREGDHWFVEILHPHHNHPVTPPGDMHTMASYRRWQRENNMGVRGAIGRLARAAALPAQRLAEFLKGEFEDPDLDRIDRQILRALSMCDTELPGEKEASADQATVLGMWARRPCIILQENGGGGGGGGVGT
ncbi:hypothetical protein F5B20DRAFT_154476 [Whalleya microplaca]|nr:hypothetical protein F5B20DRAFT_154476 [Whalleya microplaca]